MTRTLSINTPGIARATKAAKADRAAIFPLASDGGVGGPKPLPREVELVLSAIEAGQHGRGAEKRCRVRLRYRAEAKMRLFSDSPDTPAWTLYARDVEPRSLGFITQHRLPLGYGGQIELPNPEREGETILIPCTILRCRQAAPGWYEGAVYFNREQASFGMEG